jgi:hypothetical protein
MIFAACQAARYRPDERPALRRRGHRKPQSPGPRGRPEQFFLNLAIRIPKIWFRAPSRTYTLRQVAIGGCGRRSSGDVQLMIPTTYATACPDHY